MECVVVLMKNFCYKQWSARLFLRISIPPMNTSSPATPVKNGALKVKTAALSVSRKHGIAFEEKQWVIV
jgi:hypothetical protein